MAALKAAFEAMGFRNVRTVLASGNVIFETPKTDRAPVGTIAEELEKALGFPATVVLRTVQELRAIIASEPFQGAPSGPNVRLYVTFLAQKTSGLSGLRPPSSVKSIRVMRIGPGEIFSAVTLSPGEGTPDLMAFLEKAVGTDVTTRSWETVKKLAGS